MSFDYRATILRALTSQPFENTPPSGEMARVPPTPAELMSGMIRPELEAAKEALAGQFPGWQVSVVTPAPGQAVAYTLAVKAVERESSLQFFTGKVSSGVSAVQHRTIKAGEETVAKPVELVQGERGWTGIHRETIPDIVGRFVHSLASRAQ